MGFPMILQRLSDSKPEVVGLALGNLGLKLRKFADLVDGSHPELRSIFDGNLDDESPFAKKCLQLLKLTELAVDHRLDLVVSEIGKWLQTEAAFEKIDSEMVSVPSKNHVRLLKDSLERESLRESKKAQEIILDSFLRKGEEFWDSQPSDFSEFPRFCRPYDKDIKSMDRKWRTYSELGCVSLADEARQSLDRLKEFADQSYYGFNRISMTSAAVILAKRMGWIYNPLRSFVVCGHDPSKDGKIVVPKSLLGDFAFDGDEDSFLYQPRIYPLHLLASHIPDLIQLTSDLEVFPDAESKPIFDHFGVIVPGIDFPALDRYGKYSVVCGSGLRRSFEGRDSAVRYIDSFFLSQKAYRCVLVGERDGKCYFIAEN